MDSHLTDDALQRFARRQEWELWSADEHLRQCTECRARLRRLAPSGRRVEGLLRELTASPHLDFDAQLVPYVDGTLRGGTRRDVETHLAGCDVCRREVAELQPLATAHRGAAVRRRLAAGLAAAALLVLVAVTALRIARQQQTAPPPGPTPVAGVGKQPELRAVVHDGPRVIAVDAAGALSGVPLDGAMAARIASVLAHPELPPPAMLSALSFPKAALRGGTVQRDLAVLAPLGIVTLDARPRFAWRGPPGRYAISVVDEAQRRWEGETTAMEWTPPAALPRGRTYTWQVSTAIGGRTVVAPAPPALEAQFRIADQATAAAFEAARKEKGRLVAGIIAYDAGAIAEAQQEFEHLAAENRTSPVPRQLIESCKRALDR